MNKVQSQTAIPNLLVGERRSAAVSILISTRRADAEVLALRDACHTFNKLNPHAQAKAIASVNQAFFKPQWGNDRLLIIAC